MNELEIRGTKYDVTPVDAFTQLFLSRKTMPFFLKWTGDSGISFDEALADIPEEDMQAMFKRTLPYVKRNVNGSWFPIYNKQADQLMYEDIKGADIFKILYFIINLYIRDFGADSVQQD